MRRRAEPCGPSRPSPAVAAALVAPLLGPPPSIATPPDIVLLDLDLLRADVVGLVAGDGHTPAIDEFFRHGAIFTQAQSPAGYTWLSNAAVLTGREAIEMPWMAWRRLAKPSDLDPKAREGVRLLSRFPSVAERLAGAGYATVNLNQGDYSGRHAGLDRGFELYRELPGDLLAGDSALALLDVLSGSRDRPLLILFRSNALHFPYRRPAGREPPPIRPGFVFDDPEGEGRRRISFAVPLTRGTRTVAGPLDADGDDPAVYRVQVHTAAPERLLTRGDLAAMRATYEQQVRYLDAELRPVFAALDARARPTVVVLYANHGESLGDHGLFAHGTPYQECVRVPLLIRHSATQGRRIETPVSLVEILPTVCEIAGLAADPDLPGRSLVPLLAGNDVPPRPLFGRNLQDAYVRDGRFKLIVHEPGVRELYDLEVDPTETNDLAASRPDLVRRLDAMLTRRELELRSLHADDTR
jgi:arylsulfatase A-like enzyme